MLKTQVNKVLLYLAGQYTSHRLEYPLGDQRDEIKLIAWAETLDSIDYQSAMAAARTWVQGPRGAFPPSAPDILALSRQFRGQPLTEQAAWESIQFALSKCNLNHYSIESEVYGLPAFKRLVTLEAYEAFLKTEFPIRFCRPEEGERLFKRVYREILDQGQIEEVRVKMSIKSGDPLDLLE